jgi:iron complex transport system permease protein
MGEIAVENERRARRVKTSAALLILGILSALALMAACAVGSAAIPFDQVARALLDRLSGRAEGEATNALIIFGIRMPRALLAFSVGAALSVSGACMQGLFKNSMADPHILGVSSGAALGAALAMILGWQSTAMGLGAVTLTAFAGGALSVVLVVNLARVRGRTSTISLLLAGVAVSAFLSALISGLMLLNRDKLENVYLWTMGSFTAASWTKVWYCLPVTAVGAVLLRAYARDLNAMLMGEEEARSLGVPVERVRLIVLALCTVLTATAVSVSGVIGFVGLMVPHAVRMIAGPDHRSLIPVSVVAGGLYLLIIDTLARTVAMPIEIPVGVLTAVVGGPFFLYLMRKSRIEE